MTHTALREELRSHSAFRDLSDASFEATLAVTQDSTLGPGETLLREGETGRDVFLLIEGQAEAFRTAPDGSGDITLNQIEAGEIIGELAMIDGSPRGASIRVTRPSRVLRVGVEQFSDDHALADLKGALAGVAVRRARQLSTAQLASLQAQLEAREKQTQFGMVLLFTIVLMLLSTTVFYLVAEDIVQDVYAPVFSWQVVALFALPVIGIISYLRIPPRALGLQAEGFWRATIQSLILTGAIAVPVVIYAMFFKEPIPPEERPVQITAFFLAQYFLHATLQEIGARGLLQGMFQRFLDDKRGHWAVLLSSVIFGSMHIVFGAGAVLLTFIASLGFGYMYLYQKNLAGVVILHYGLGVMGAFLVAL